MAQAVSAVAEQAAVVNLPAPQVEQGTHAVSAVAEQAAA
jgi:hypothetical protein